MRLLGGSAAKVPGGDVAGHGKLGGGAAEWWFVDVTQEDERELEEEVIRLSGLDVN